MAGEADIAPLSLTGERGITPDARRGASSLCTQRCASSSRASSARTGRPSRSLAGRSSAVRRITPAGCRTRRSTRPCSSRRAVRRSASRCCVCEGPVPSAGPTSLRASMPAQGQIRDASRFESAPPQAEDRAVPGHWEGDLLRGRRLESLAGLEGGADPRIRTPPSAGTWIARMRVASETRNLLLCPTHQATGHSYNTSGCATVCMPAY